MTQEYIGVKKVTAWPETRDGEEGYAVKYEDGYISWSPKAVFEKAYLAIGHDGTRIEFETVDNFLLDGEVQRMGNHTVLKANCRNGFTTLTESACVDPANYDEQLGADNARKKALNQIWGHLGFVLAWATNGLK